MKRNPGFTLKGKGHEPRSIRFICSCSGGVLKLIRTQKVAAKAPPDELAGIMKAGYGSWIEIRQSDGTALYRRLIHDYFNDDIEVMTGRKEEELSWQKAPGLERTIVFLVPDLPGADHLVVISERPEEKNISSVEIARFQMKF